MDNNQQVDVGTVLGSIAQVLQDNRGNLNEVDNGQNGGTHGDRIAQAFETAAQAAQNAGTDDAGQQLSVAADAMRQNGQGRAVNHYANGLQQAASHFMGRRGISINDLLPFLQSFLGGVQQGNSAQPGQGTMIDALGPAVSSLLSGQQQGMNPIQSAIGAITSAIGGTRGTAQTRGGQVDPGAASATSIIGGLVKSVLPGALGALMGGLGGGLGGGGSQQQPQYPSQPDYQGQLQAEPSSSAGGYGGQGTQSTGMGSIGDILGQLTGGGSQSGGMGGLGGLLGGASGGSSGGGGLGSLLGGLLGGSQDTGSVQTQSGQKKGGWWPF